MENLIKKLSQTTGFTLMEVVVATGIFIIMVLATLGIFSSVLQAQQNTIAQTRLEREAQLVLETMVKSVRSSRVDYDEYERISGQPDPAMASPTSTLILINFSDERVMYQFDSASNTINVINSGNVNVLTSDIVAVTGLDFFIEPRANPFMVGQPPASQPRVTIVLSIQSTLGDDTVQARIQQTAPQRGGAY